MDQIEIHECRTLDQRIKSKTVCEMAKVYKDREELHMVWTMQSWYSSGKLPLVEFIFFCPFCGKKLE